MTPPSFGDSATRSSLTQTTFWPFTHTHTIPSPSVRTVSLLTRHVSRVEHVRSLGSLDTASPEAGMTGQLLQVLTYY